LNYLFFFLRDNFGFGNRQNLWITALHGLLYALAAWQGGKFAQRHGFLTSLKLGFAGLTLAMIAGGLLHSFFIGIICGLICYTLVLLLTWPALEALVIENETTSAVPRMVGIYNCTWSAGAALAYFTGGKLYDLLGRGAVFWLPAMIFAGQFFITLWLARQATGIRPPEIKSAGMAPHHPDSAAFRQPVSPQTFLKLAWLSSPC